MNVRIIGSMVNFLPFVCVQGWQRVIARVHGFHDQSRDGERQVQRGDRERLPRAQHRGQALRHQRRTLPGNACAPHVSFVLLTPQRVIQSYCESGCLTLLPFFPTLRMYDWNYVIADQIL